MKGNSLKKRYVMISFIPLYFFIIGIFSQDFFTLIPGLYNIIVQPDLLITDYIIIGGIGATFINASITTLITLFILYKLDLEISGQTIAVCFMMLGFSMFGKNFLNIWMILLGVFLYSKYHNEPLKEYIFIGFYGTSLSPIITQLMQSAHVLPVTKLIISLSIGLVIGFVLPPLTKYLYSTHGGFSLYNVGFSAGILSTVIVSVLKSFGVETSSVLIWSTGNNSFFCIILCVFFMLLIIFGFFKDAKGFKSYKLLIKNSGVANPNFVDEYGLSATFINMGINGIIATLLVVLVGGDLNGPTIGGICTIVGFSATGKHMLNITPILLGVLVASLFKVWDIHDPACMITLLFSTTLAPIAGKYGIIAGILAGFIHSSVALHIIVLYDGMNLYNNGFAGGIVACFMVPILDSFIEKK